MTEFEKNPNPTKDQHFMIDTDLINYICRKANIQEGESIVEVGGGAGALTEVLARLGNPLTVIELDHYYADLLKEKFKNYQNVKVVEGNALEMSYLEYDRIVANLPYTITEPFLVNLAQSGALYVNNKDKKSSRVKSITLVLSQNSTRKMVAPIQISEGNSKHLNLEFGLISAICQTYLSVEIDRVIPSNAFFPEPSVTSFLVNLIPKKKKTTVDRIMEEILMDRNRKRPTISRIYQMMLVQGKIYNLNKHKNSSNQNFCGNFTSKKIGESSVYDLNNAQISQLLQDLVKNDSKIKGAKASRNCFEEDLYKVYLRTGRYDDYDELEEDTVVVTKTQKKAAEKYAYLYDEKRYNALLHRGLEFVSKDELMEMLG